MNHVEVLEHENNDLHQQVINLEKLKYREHALKTRVKEMMSELENYKQKNKDELSAQSQNKKANQDKLINLELELSKVKKSLEEAQQQIEIQNKKKLLWLNNL